MAFGYKPKSVIKNGFQAAALASALLAPSGASAEMGAKNVSRDHSVVGILEQRGNHVSDLSAGSGSASGPAKDEQRISRSQEIQGSIYNNLDRNGFTSFGI